MVGTHLLLNVYNVKSLYTLETIQLGKVLLDKIVRESNLTVVAEVGHQFTPRGYTYAYVLSESHFTIHTYPENNSCYIDIFCCNKDFNWRKTVECVKKVFDTNVVSIRVIPR
jgi:S-adenosylmethionine decarboxylase